jgi:hypothetical protein
MRPATARQVGNYYDFRAEPPQHLAESPTIWDCDGAPKICVTVAWELLSARPVQSFRDAFIPPAA